MNQRDTILVILRGSRLVFLIIAVSLIPTGPGAEFGPSAYAPGGAVGKLPIDNWKYTEKGHIIGQYFPFIVTLIILIVTLLLVVVPLLNKQGELKQATIIIDVICIILLFIATCLEAWFAAGGSDKYGTSVLGYAMYFPIKQVDGWIAATAFMALSLITLVLDAIYTRKEA